MTPHARQEVILRHLRRAGSATLQEIALSTGASRRTTLRDIGSLREQGFLIHGDSGRGGGLRLDPTSMTLTARLSVTEVFALLIAVASLRAAGTLPFGSLADTGLSKIERALAPEQVRDFRSLLDCLHVGQLSPLQDLKSVGQIDPDLLASFERAFLSRCRMRFCYTDRRGETSAREVEPQALLVLPPLWYLVAWDPSRDGFRHFRTDRIAAPVAVNDLPFRRRRVPFEKDICPYAELERRARPA